jgi:hypothetical protein
MCILTSASWHSKKKSLPFADDADFGFRLLEQGAVTRNRDSRWTCLLLLHCSNAVNSAVNQEGVILYNHSAHISRETRAWLATRPLGRFEFTFTSKHDSWLNLIEGIFSKFARSVLRHIRMASKHEFKERIMAGIDDVNRHPVVHTGSYKLAEAA